AINPSHGSVTVNSVGTYSYTRAVNYSGSDSFTYTVSDGHGGSNTYTVSITVNPVNDAPTAANVSVTTNEDTARSGTLPAATDIEGQNVADAKTSDAPPGAGTVNSDGTY